MIRAWRITKDRHRRRAFTGEGARIAGGRWNFPGQAVVCCSGSLALASLETFVHLEKEAGSLQFVSFEIRIPHSIRMERCTARPHGWRDEPPGEQSMRVGSRWLTEAKSAVLEVPSALVPTESNYLLNPLHRDFAKISISSPRPFTFDPRMWK